MFDILKPVPRSEDGVDMRRFSSFIHSKYEQDSSESPEGNCSRESNSSRSGQEVAMALAVVKSR